MASKPEKKSEHMFSIQLKSKDHVKSIALPHDMDGNVLIEGFLGKLENLAVTEGIMLEVNGSNGSLRMDFTELELQLLLHKRTLKNESTLGDNRR